MSPKPLEHYLPTLILLKAFKRLQIDDLKVIMSRPGLHELLEEVFDSKEPSALAKLYNYPGYTDLAKKYDLTIPAKDLALAFTHTSFAHEFSVPHQEQLEFLGDSVLQLILTDVLFTKFPEEKEGPLSKRRSALVNEASLATISSGLGLHELIIVGKGEFKKKLFEQAPVMADTFEAFLAQIYRYHGLDFTKKIFLNWLNTFIPSAFDEKFLDDFDAKSKLQEKVLAKYKKVPRYTATESGSEFEVTLWINEAPVANGLFSSKKSGEKSLAQDVLKKGHF